MRRLVLTLFVLLGSFIGLISVDIRSLGIRQSSYNINKFFSYVSSRIRSKNIYHT